jgi:hypothetical protein
MMSYGSRPDAEKDDHPNDVQKIRLLKRLRRPCADSGI